MKPKNFPARKLARQISAKQGGSCRDVPAEQLEQARSERTKKNRSATGKRRI